MQDIISIPLKQKRIYAQLDEEPHQTGGRRAMESGFVILEDLNHSTEPTDCVRLVFWEASYLSLPTGWMGRYVRIVAPHVLRQHLTDPDSLPRTSSGEIITDKWRESGPGAGASLDELSASLDGGKAGYNRICRQDILHVLLEHYDEAGARDGLTVVQIMASPLKRRFYEEGLVQKIVQTLNAEQLVHGDRAAPVMPYSWWVNAEKASDVRHELAAASASAISAAQSLPRPAVTGEYDAFLCHASEDKAAIVRPFAKAMCIQGLRPWIDEGELLWGDKLVQKIQHGLTKSKSVVVFLTPAFLGKSWPETELNTALTLEVDGRSVVLPILCGVAHSELQQRYPIVLAKLYKEVPEYDARHALEPGCLAGLVSEMSKRLDRDAR
jgi:hypothetical protein